MIERLRAAIEAAAPIVRVSVGTLGDPATVRIGFAPEATAEQQAAAQAVVNAFDWSAEAHAAWLAERVPERKALRGAAAQAIQANVDFLANASPNNAAVLAQVRELSRQNNRIIRRLIQLD